MPNPKPNTTGLKPFVLKKKEIAKLKKNKKQRDAYLKEKMKLLDNAAKPGEYVDLYVLNLTINNKGELKHANLLLKWLELKLKTNVAQSFLDGDNF